MKIAIIITLFILSLFSKLNAQYSTVGFDKLLCGNGYTNMCTSTESFSKPNKPNEAEFYKKLCKEGDVNSCTYLASMYYEGINGEKDYFKAKSLYEIACDNNHSYGCYFLGLMYQEGKGVKQNHFKAVSAYKKICDNDFYLGCQELAIMYKKGEGVKQNDKIAVDLLKKSCDGNLGSSCLGLGLLYVAGDGVMKSDSKAKTYFGKACDNKVSDGCKEYALLNKALSKKTPEKRIKKKVSHNNTDNLDYFTIRGRGEECIVGYNKNGSLQQTNCLSLTNSKGIPILCTKKKTVCKTERELISSFSKGRHDYFRTSKGTNFKATYNKYGAILKSISFTIYLGNSCDVTSPNFGMGIWKDGGDIGFLIQFKNKRIIFPNQQIHIRNNSRCI